ncbi:hypothetical protein LEMLEM_LOCUS18691 [Lemmus lemmus]
MSVPLPPACVSWRVELPLGSGPLPFFSPSAPASLGCWRGRGKVQRRCLRGSWRDRPQWSEPRDQWALLTPPLQLEHTKQFHHPKYSRVHPLCRQPHPVYQSLGNLQ